MSCRLAGVRRACALRARVTTNTARYSMTRQATVAIVAATSASASSTDVSFNVAQHSGSAPLPVCTPCSVRVGFGAQKSRPGGAVPLPAGRRNGQYSAGGCKRPFVVCSTVNTMNLTAPHAFTLLGAQSRNNARMIHAAFRPGKCRTMITGRRAPTRSERSRGRRKLPPARAASGLDGRVLAQHERMGVSPRRSQHERGLAIRLHLDHAAPVTERGDLPPVHPLSLLAPQATAVDRKPT